MDEGPRPETNDECFKDGAPTTAPTTEPVAEPAAAVAEPEPAEDTEPKELGNSIAADIQKEADKAMAVAEMAEVSPEPL